MNVARLRGLLSKSNFNFFRRNMHGLPSFPFEVQRGLLPLFSKESLDNHINTAHLANVKRANEILRNHEGFEGLTLEKTLFELYKDTQHQNLFNNLSMHWNHSFFWEGLMHNHSLNITKFPHYPSEKLIDLFNIHFGSFEKFKLKFKHHARAVFGSGWVFLVAREGHLEILVFPNADTPAVLKPEIIPLLALDLWEHSFYPDYDGNISKYVDNFWYNVNWAIVEERLPEVAIPDNDLKEFIKAVESRGDYEYIAPDHKFIDEVLVKLNKDLELSTEEHMTPKLPSIINHTNAKLFYITGDDALDLQEEEDFTNNLIITHEAKDEITPALKNRLSKIGVDTKFEDEEE